MGALQLASGFISLPSGTVWPDPSDPTEIQDRLRYGKPTPSDLAVAAAHMAAYRYMVLELPQRTRNQRVSELREAVAPSPTGGEG